MRGGRSIRIVEAALAVMSLPSLAAGQGITVRKFQSAAEFVKAARLQRFSSGTSDLSLPRVPPGIPGYYDPATKTFRVVAASPLGPGASLKMPAEPAAAGSQLCAPPGHIRSCSGFEETNITLNIVSPGIKSGDTVFCRNDVMVTTTTTASGDSLPDDETEKSVNFGVGQTESVTNYFEVVYPATHGGYAYLRVYTTCRIPNASDGQSYGPLTILNQARAIEGDNPFGATFNF